MNPAVVVAIALALSAPAVAVQQPSGLLPASTLPLKLVGVVLDTTTPSRSAGLIRCGYPQESRGARLFAVGERACDVAEVTEVKEEAVVIRNLLTDRLELLTLPKAGARSAAPASPGEAPAETKADAPAPRVQSSSPDVVTVELRKEVLDHYLANLPEVLDSALATPRYASSATGPPAIEGYEISRIKAGSIVEQLGLRDGDVVLEVNGQRLNGLAAVMGLVGQAQAIAGAKMTVLRSGRRVTFVFDVK